MKRGYLGIFEGAYLAGRSAGFRDQLKEHGISVPETTIPIDKMIYVAAFQGGIEKFVSPLSASSAQPIDQFISKRISKPTKQSYRHLPNLMSLQSAMLPAGKESSALMALSFIHDLIVGMENDATIINVSGVPTVEDVKRFFPPEIALPVCNILSSVKATDELLPAPAQVISRDGVNRFRELLESDVYSRYAAAHRQVDFSSNTNAISEIRARGTELLKAGKGALLSRRVSLNVLSVVPKIVDAAFGKLPGALAQAAGDLATRFMEDKKNIVIYQFDDWANEYHKTSFEHFLSDVSKATNTTS